MQENRYSEIAFESITPIKHESSVEASGIKTCESTGL